MTDETDDRCLACMAALGCAELDDCAIPERCICRRCRNRPSEQAARQAQAPLEAGRDSWGEPEPGRRCEWCNTDPSEAAVRHEGPHATW